MKKLLLFVCSVFLFAGLTMEQNHDYVGASKCKMCHNKASKGAQYNVWKSGPHASAFATLATEEAKEFSENPQKDPKCLKCHSTYHSADADLMYTIKETEGVSCESCHGAGADYKTNGVMKDKAKSLASGLIEPTDAVCKKCHNKESPTYKPFVYAEKVSKIAHPKPAQD